jgi:hypothetical protein
MIDGRSETNRRHLIACKDKSKRFETVADVYATIGSDESAVVNGA